MAEITLKHGQIALVDDGDFEHLSGHKWHINNKGYAYRYNGYRRNAKGKPVSIYLYMHREILGLKRGESEVDHINGNPLDNRRENLRPANRSLQTINSKRPKNLSGWRGVAYCKFPQSWNAKKVWRAQIKLAGKMYYGGYFYNPREAALRYNDMALQFFGPKFRFFNQVFAGVGVEE